MYIIKSYLICIFKRTYSTIIYNSQKIALKKEGKPQLTSPVGSSFHWLHCFRKTDFHSIG